LFSPVRFPGEETKTTTNPIRKEVYADKRYHKKRLMLLGLSALGLYAIISLLGTSNAPAAANGPPNVSAMVVNTTANPVPVVQQGAATVSGNLTVANTAANPVPVTLQASTAQPVRVKFDSNNFGVGYNVPAGKRLHITYYNASVSVFDSTCPDQSYGVASLTTATHTWPLTVSAWPNNLVYYSGAAPMDILIDSGEKLSASLAATVCGSTPTFVVELTGTLVDASGPPILDVP
jgi:hypothetical protein